MQAVGNFNWLHARASRRSRPKRPHNWRALSSARGRARSAGTRIWTDDAAVALKLPERLPDLPAAPPDEGRASNALDQARCAIGARSNLDYLARTQG